MRPLSSDFFQRNTTEVAADLIGTLLVHEHPSGERLVARVVETEAYTQEDPACHAWNVIDPRTGAFREDRRGASLFGPPGRAYVYLNYGMYWLLNVVTEPEGRGGAVLIRAAEPLEGPGIRRPVDLTNGPGKLVLAMGITADLHERMLTEPPVYFSRNGSSAPVIQTSARIGITRGASLPWRYFEAGNPYVSPGIPSDATVRRPRRRAAR